MCGVSAAGLVGVWAGGVAVRDARAATAGRSQGRYTAEGRGQTTTFARAEAERGRLEAVPEGERTKAEYDRALDAYRAVYHGAPTDVHAAEAVYQVARLLAEEGRTRRDAGLLRAALAQDEFLRKQYPGSSWRVPALLEEGRIEARDLGNAAAAQERWELLVQLYPGSAAATEARSELAGMREDGTAAGVGPGKNERGGRGGVGERAVEGGGAANAATGLREGTGVGSTLGGQAGSGAGYGSVADPGSVEVAGSVPVAGARAMRGGKPAAVTGIRHWSTASYTRVAIDLGDEVEYRAARVTGPDRIYFDLLGTRLAPELVGKSFAVTDDGFLKRIRAAQFSDNMTRVVLDVNQVTEYSAFLLPNPYRLIIDIHGAKRGSEAEPATTAGAGTGTAEGAAPVPAPATARVVTPTVAKPVPNTVTVPAMGTTAEVARVSEQPGRREATSAPTTGPVAEVVRRRPGAVASGANNERGDRGGGTADATGAVAVGGDVPAATAVPATSPKRGRKSKATVADGTVVGVPGSLAVPGAPARAAVPTADGQTSLVRALGLKVGRIVIDAGHGGHDSGTLGADGIEEKDVVLDVALRLGKLLHQRLGAEVIYTRSDDTFIPLETRTAIANKAQADLFLSIHANSSADASARGVETYYLNFTTDPTALNVAARENAVSDQSVGQLSDLVRKIALKDKIAESREFAGDVEESLYAGLQRGNAGLKDRGVKKAPFVVLIGANMPSVLAEISFVTNPRDASELRQPEYRERVAESLYKGVAKYQAGLSGGQTPRGEDGMVQVGSRAGR